MSKKRKTGLAVKESAGEAWTQFHYKRFEKTTIPLFDSLTKMFCGVSLDSMIRGIVENI